MSDIELIATVGGEDSNSYVTLSEASEYFAASVQFAATWEGYSDHVKIQRLVTAARSVDRFAFRGAKVSASQSMEFPRQQVRSYWRGVGYFGGWPLVYGWCGCGGAVGTNDLDTPDSIPRRVKDAQLEMVLVAVAKAGGATGASSGADNMLMSLGLGRGALNVQFGDATGNANEIATLGGVIQTVEALLEPWIGSGRNSFRWE